MIMGGFREVLAHQYSNPSSGDLNNVQQAELSAEYSYLVEIPTDPPDNFGYLQ